MAYLIIFVSYIVLAVSYITVGKLFSVGLNAFGYSSDAILIAIGSMFLLVTLWSLAEARNQRKYFKKRLKDESMDQTLNETLSSSKFSQAYAANLSANVIGITCWLFLFNDNFAIVNGVFLTLALLMAICFIVETAVRIYVSKVLIGLDTKTVIWSSKFVIIEHFIIYGFIAWLSYSISKYSGIG